MQVVGPVHFFPPFGATVQLGSRPPRCWGF